MPIDVRTSQAAPLYYAPLGFSASALLTRPNDSTAYGAVDVVGDAAAGGVLQFTFPSIPKTGADVIIDAVRFEVLDTGLVSTEATYNLALYNRPQPSNYADNAVYDVTAADRAAYQGLLALTTPVDIGSTLYVEVNFTKRVSLLSPTLYAYLVTVTGYTPTALRAMRLWVYGRMI